MQVSWERPGRGMRTLVRGVLFPLTTCHSQVPFSEQGEGPCSLITAARLSRDRTVKHAKHVIVRVMPRNRRGVTVARRLPNRREGYRKQCGSQDKSGGCNASQMARLHRMKPSSDPSSATAVEPTVRSRVPATLERTADRPVAAALFDRHAHIPAKHHARGDRTPIERQATSSLLRQSICDCLCLF